MVFAGRYCLHQYKKICKSKIYDIWIFLESVDKKINIEILSNEEMNMPVCKNCASRYTVKMVFSVENSVVIVKGIIWVLLKVNRTGAAIEDPKAMPVSIFIENIS